MDDLTRIITPQDQVQLLVSGLAEDCRELGSAALDAALYVAKLGKVLADLDADDEAKAAVAFANSIVDRVDAVTHARAAPDG